MKYCPYCGVYLKDSAFSFCPECGNTLSETSHNSDLEDSRLYWMKRADNIEQAKNEVEENTIESEEMDKAYDGYYDDIVPDDFGNYQFQKSNGNLMKRIVLVIAGALAAIIISAVVMYYL